MASKKSSYNERFSFDDPLSKWSTCRSTRNRAFKKLKDARDRDPSLSADMVVEDTDQNEEGNVTVVDDSQEMQDTSMSSSGYADSNIDLIDNTNSESPVNNCKHLQCAEVGTGSLSEWDTNFDECYDIDRDCIEVVNCPQSLENEVVSPEETSLHVQSEAEEVNEPTLENTEQTNPVALLYSNAPITTMCSNVILMKFVMKHRITQEALSDLLKVLQLHLPSPNNAPFTLYHFRKNFTDLQYPVIYHHFCSKCLMPASLETEVCENTLCKSVFSERYSKSNFIEIPIHLQLKCILERKYTFILMHIMSHFLQ